MDAQLKQKWVEALRSGKYEQGRGQLFDDGKYCCLGVFCQVAGLEIENGNRVAGTPAGEDGYHLISEKIAFSTSELFKRNDGLSPYERQDFHQIADYIEANIPAEA